MQQHGVTAPQIFRPAIMGARGITRWWAEICGRPKGKGQEFVRGKEVTREVLKGIYVHIYKTVYTKKREAFIQSSCSVSGSGIHLFTSPEEEK